MRNAEPIQPRPEAIRNLAAAPAAQFQSQSRILINGAVQQERLLKHHGDAPAYRQRVGRAHANAVELNRACARRFAACPLPGAMWSYLRRWVRVTPKLLLR